MYAEIYLRVTIPMPMCITLGIKKQINTAVFSYVNLCWRRLSLADVRISRTSEYL